MLNLFVRARLLPILIILTLALAGYGYWLVATHVFTPNAIGLSNAATIDLISRTGFTYEPVDPSDLPLTVVSQEPTAGKLVPLRSHFSLENWRSFTAPRGQYSRLRLDDRQLVLCEGVAAPDLEIHPEVSSTVITFGPGQPVVRAGILPIHIGQPTEVFAADSSGNSNILLGGLKRLNLHNTERFDPLLLSCDRSGNTIQFDTKFGNGSQVVCLGAGWMQKGAVVAYLMNQSMMPGGPDGYIEMFDSDQSLSGRVAIQHSPGDAFRSMDRIILTNMALSRVAVAKLKDGLFETHEYDLHGSEVPRSGLKEPGWKCIYPHDCVAQNVTGQVPGFLVLRKIYEPLDSYYAVSRIRGGKLDDEYTTTPMYETTFENVLGVSNGGSSAVLASTIGDPKTVLRRFDPNGEPGRGFGKEGLAELPFQFRKAAGVNIGGDGSVIVAGDEEGSLQRRLSLMRVDANGKLDQQFGDRGHVLIGAGKDAYASLMLSEPSGHQILVGTVSDPENNFSTHIIVARFNRDGMLDRGMVATPLVDPSEFGESDPVFYLDTVDDQGVFRSKAQSGRVFRIRVNRLPDGGLKCEYAIEAR